MEAIKPGSTASPGTDVSSSMEAADAFAMDENEGIRGNASRKKSMTIRFNIRRLSNAVAPRVGGPTPAATSAPAPEPAPVPVPAPAAAVDVTQARSRALASSERPASTTDGSETAPAGAGRTDASKARAWNAKWIAARERISDAQAATRFSSALGLGVRNDSESDSGSDRATEAASLARRTLRRSSAVFVAAVNQMRRRVVQPSQQSDDAKRALPGYTVV